MMDFNYCPYCGKKQMKRKKLGLNLKAKGQTIPNGFIEILYEEGSRKMDSPEAPNSLGRFRGFADGDMDVSHNRGVVAESCSLFGPEQFPE